MPFNCSSSCSLLFYHFPLFELRYNVPENLIHVNSMSLNLLKHGDQDFHVTEVPAVMILNFRTDKSGQTVQTKIRLLLEEHSDQGLHCLLFHLHVFGKTPSGFASLFEH